MNFINLTPHAVHLSNATPGEADLVFPSQGAVRLLQEPLSDNMGDQLVALVGDREVAVTAVGAPQFVGIDQEGDGWMALCAANPQTDIVLVSMPVGEYLTKHTVEGVSRRLTIAGPNTGPGPEGAVRDAEGRIVGARTIVMYGSTP